ncbi:hypothetical protein [Teichococcus wenyumeiae]|uniref:hypothetical protein n=1 Tax=Teichococcus wenyumeiae TaxID=2478470 RepID=UPI0011C43059|nr:hypothetical protein [Pseudoroseomonas wenyumeiae]
MRDVARLYLATRDRALVLCVVEKPQIQAAQDKAPAFLMQPGQAERPTSAHRCQSTLDLFAALDGTGLHARPCDGTSYTAAL